MRWCPTLIDTTRIRAEPLLTGGVVLTATGCPGVCRRMQVRGASISLCQYSAAYCLAYREVT